MRLPTIGLSRPPAEPGGGVISVNTASDRPEKPSHNRAPRMSTSQPRPTAVAASASTLAMALRRRRPWYRDCASASAMPSPNPALDAQQQVARDRQHDESDDEQNEPERDQGGSIKVTHRFGEFVGDRG